MFRAALSAALVALASLQQTYAQAAWHMDTLNMLTIARLDPVVSPNQVSSHMHAIVGGSAFSAAYNYADQIASSCTTASLTVDKSNYWMPQLYWVNDDGSFVPLDNKPRFYYFLGRNSNAEPVSPFPEGLRMLTGDPNSKTANPKTSFTCHINADLTTGSIIQDNFNFNRDCPYGIRIEITFKSCWDGINLYKSDNSHVVDPSNSQSDRVGGCPFSHPVRIPLIMFEMTFRPSAWAPGVATAGHLAWANGDMTGYGVHADFVNGWDTKVLAAALNDTQCAPATQQAMSIQNCNVFAPYYQANPQCSPQKGQMNEPGSTNTNLVPIQSLAGCNPVWTSGPKPGCSSAQPAPDVTNWKGTDGPYQATGSAVKTFSLPTTGGIQQVACIKDNGGSVVTNGYTYYDNSVTGTSCMNTCLKAGYKFAATGFANGRWDCRCGDGILSTASTYPGMCTTPCPGDSSQMCGSTDVHSVYYATNGTTANYTMGQTTPGYGGCYSPKGTNSLSTRITYQYTDNNLTPDSCLQVCANMNATWAGTTAGRTCMCGTDMTLGTGVYVADSYCAQPCGGNANVTCGATSYWSLYKMSATGVVAQTNPNQPPGRKGCYQDNTGAGLTGYSWVNNAMTVDQCNYGCAELGYSLSGLIFGNRCRCGNTWTGGQIYPDSNCNSPCTGNSSETCGGNYKTEMYDTAPALALVQADIAARPAGWIGCVANSPGTALTNYNAYDGQLTVERCIATCNTYGYAFAGMANGAYCRCGNTDPRTVVQQVPSAQYCTASCPGNSTETCGNAGAYTDSYNVTAYVQASKALSSSKTPGYVGCYSGTSGLSAYSFTQSDMSVDVCTMGCKEMGYSLAGVSSGTCYCDNTWSSGDALADYRCNSPCPGAANQTCGAYAVTSLWNSSIGATPAAAKETGYVGCFTDSSSRTLGSYTYTSPAMTNTLCKASCANQGYAYAGTEAGNQCFCANAIGSSASKIASTQCTSSCAGNSALICGGSWKLSLFNSSATGVSPSASTSANATSPSGAVKLKSKGCYTDTSTLDQGAYTSAYMTVDQCVSYCKSMSYAWAGLTNGNACRCGNTSPSNLAGPLCTTPCVSNAQQTCGGSGYTEVWPTTQTGLVDTFSASAADSNGYMGCWQDGSARTLNGSSFTSSTLTPISCRANCYALGLTFSGVESGSQCYCGSTIKAGRIRYADSSCSATCSGDKTQNCGGSWAMNIRIRPANAGATTSTVAPSATVGVNATASVNGTKTGSTASASSAVPTSANIEGYKGCYGVGTLVSGATAKYTGLGTMTTGWCRRFCRASGFSMAGLQGGNSCYCGSASQVDKKVSDVACTATCSGDSSTICGDTFLTSLYDTVGAGALGQPGMPKNWVGCFADQSARTLPGWSFTSSAMTSENCRLSCSAKGYSTYGTESGNQCYCGPSLPTNMVGDNLCNAKCAGNSSEICGGSWRLSVYNAAFASSSNDPVVSSALPSASASKAASASASSSKAVSASASSSKAASVSASSSKAASASASSSKAASASASVSKAASSSKAASVVPSSTSKAASVAPSSSKAASSAAASPSKAASSAALPSPSKAATSASASPSKRASETPSSSATASAASTIGGGGLIASPSPKPSSSSAAAASSSKAASSAAATSAASSASKAPVSSAAPSSAVVSSTTSAIAPSATNHLGCYTQGTPAILDKSVITCDTLTPGMCKLWCNANNYAYAGMTNGTTCGCASDITALTPVAASQCNKACFSDKTVTCGGQAGTTYNVWKSSGLIARRNHRKRLRMIQGHGGAARRQEAPMHFNSEQEILYYLKRNQPEQ